MSSVKDVQVAANLTVRVRRRATLAGANGSEAPLSDSPAGGPRGSFFLQGPLWPDSDSRQGESLAGLRFTQAPGADPCDYLASTGSAP